MIPKFSGKFPMTRVLKTKRTEDDTDTEKVVWKRRQRLGLFGPKTRNS
jgi:hypothetical protein